MLKQITTDNGKTVLINPNHVVCAELNIATNSWKIFMVRKIAYDTQEFDTKDAAMSWFENALG